jgi:hypothetical protein
MDKIIKYVHKHPPRCIIDLHPKPTIFSVPTIRKPWPYSVFHGNCSGDGTASFLIGCPCGHRAIFLLGYCIKNESNLRVRELVGPLSLECALCGVVTDFFDTRIHGYDGEQGVNTYIIGEGTPDRFTCPCCGAKPMFICAHFSYPDYDDFGEKMKIRREDYFEGLVIVGQCINCNDSIEIMDFECA